MITSFEPNLTFQLDRLSTWICLRFVLCNCVDGEKWTIPGGPQLNPSWAFSKLFHSVMKFIVTNINSDIIHLTLVVTDDHSFKHGCFPISIQYLTTALRRILFSSVVMVLAYQPGGPGSNHPRILYFLPCIHSFLTLLRTLFVRWGLVRDWPLSH